MKLHLVYDSNADRSIHAVVSTANVNDTPLAQPMPVEPGDDGHKG